MSDVEKLVATPTHPCEAKQPARHGYGIAGEIAELSQGQVKLTVGSLYGVLDRLVSEGLIEHDRAEPHDGRLHRYYRFTRDGRRALAEDTDHFRAHPK